MQRILFFLLLLTFSFFGYGQITYPPTGNANGLNRFLGGLKVDSAFWMPVKCPGDWSNTGLQNGNVTLCPTDTTIYFYASGSWRKLAKIADFENYVSYGDSLIVFVTPSQLHDSLVANIDTNFIRNQILYDQVANYRITGQAIANNFMAKDIALNHGYSALATGNANESGYVVFFNPSQNMVGLIGYSPDKIRYDAYIGYHDFQLQGVSKARIDSTGIVVNGSVRQNVTDSILKANEDGKIIGAEPTVDYVPPQQLYDSLNAVDLNSITFTGTATKTIRITKNNGAWLEGTFTDNDNQTLSLSATDVLSITGGNSITLPYLRSLPGSTYNSYSGTATNTFVLPNTPVTSSGVFVTMNNAWIDPVDWTRSGNTITLSFTTSTTDLITIYYNH